MKKAQGFTIIELIIAMVIITVILLVVVPVGQTATDNSRVANAMSSIKAIETAAVGWANDNGGQYTGISFTQLTNGYLPLEFTPKSTDPWNGDYTVNVNSNDATKIDISLSNVPTGPAAKLTTALTKIAAASGSPSYADGIWSITLQ